MMDRKTGRVVYNGRKYFRQGNEWYDAETYLKVPIALETDLNQAAFRVDPVKSPISFSASQYKKRKKAKKRYRRLVASDRNEDSSKNDIYKNFYRLPDDRFRS